ncbi:MAG: hypothetical protein JXR25_05725 [Pontiellaceae bacterium]|nr:hypothetical protein [Pontiellaceae bacterium]MBN2784306.1 hypothetical protein [Pontiellaceae bacterium]
MGFALLVAVLLPYAHLAFESHHTGGCGHRRGAQHAPEKPSQTSHDSCSLCKLLNLQSISSETAITAITHFVPATNRLLPKTESGRTTPTIKRARAPPYMAA